MNEKINCIVIGCMDNTIDHTHESANRILNVEGICSTLNTCGGGNLQPKILEKSSMNNIQPVMIGGERKHQAVKTDGISTTPVSSMGTGGGYVPMVTEKIRIKQATKEGYIEMENGGVFDAAYPDSKTRRGRVQGGGSLSPTLTAQNSELYRIEAKAIKAFEENDCEPGDTINPFNESVDKSGCSPTITTRPEGMKTAILPVTKEYRIRKLTPLECFRLMGVTDSDAQKMISVNSNSQCYKQAGNSIVVDVMAAMFRILIG